MLTLPYFHWVFGHFGYSALFFQTLHSSISIYVGMSRDSCILDDQCGPWPDAAFSVLGLYCLLWINCPITWVNAVMNENVGTRGCLFLDPCSCWRSSLGAGVQEKAFAAIVLPKNPTMVGLINFMGNPCCIMFSELGGIENDSFALDPCSWCACHYVQGFGVKLIWVYTVCSDLIVRPLG